MIPDTEGGFCECVFLMALIQQAIQSFSYKSNQAETEAGKVAVINRVEIDLPPININDF